MSKSIKKVSIVNIVSLWVCGEIGVDEKESRIHKLDLDSLQAPVPRGNISYLIFDIIREGNEHTIARSSMVNVLFNSWIYHNMKV